MEEIMDFDSLDTDILTLGTPKIKSPLNKNIKGTNIKNFISDNDKVIVDVYANNLKRLYSEGKTPPSIEQAGPREKIFFDPSKLKCALVTCGGLCPGLNDIIRSIVLGLYYGYGVKNIYGIKYGLQGFIPKYGHDILDLTPEFVADILNTGGSVLGSSRGPQDIEEIVDWPSSIYKAKNI